MVQRSEHDPIAVLALRSISGFSGALAGMAGSVGYIIGILVTELSFGRAGPNQMAGTIVFGLPILGTLGALVGGLIGLVIGLVVGRTSLAGPADRRAVAAAVGIAALLGGLVGARAAARSEAENRPRVIQSSGAITRLEGGSGLTTVTESTLVYTRTPGSEEPRSLVWQGRELHIRVEDDVLIIADSMGLVSQAGLRQFDYVTDVYGATANLEPEWEEWLAVLVGFRSTGRRSLLLIYDPTGALVFQELLARARGPGLSTAGSPMERQEFVLDLGRARRYGVQR